MSKQDLPGSGLEPIEKASRDELHALQLAAHAVVAEARLRQCAALSPEVRRRRRASGRPQAVVGSRQVSFYDQARSAPTPIPTACSRRRCASGEGARFVRHTGKPTVVGYTKNDIAMWANLMARSLRAAGCSADDIILNSYGYGPIYRRPWRALWRRVPGRHGDSHRRARPKSRLQLIQDFKPTVIMSTPSYVLTIADEMIKQGMKPKQSSCASGVFGAEPVDQRKCGARSRSAWASDAIDIYGLSEVMGPGVSCEVHPRPRMVRISGKTISTRRSSIRKPARRAA